MRQRFATFPAADQAQLLVAGQAIEKIRRARQIVDRFGDEGAGNRLTAAWRTTVPAPRTRYEPVEGNQFQNRHQATRHGCQFADFGLQRWKQLVL